MSALYDFIYPRFFAPVPAEHGLFCQATLVTLQTNLVVGYATGVLTSNPPKRHLYGDLKHYFSDRTWDNPATAKVIERNPFNPAAVDSTRLGIEESSPESVAITLTSNTWRTQSRLTVISCSADVLVCIGPGVGAHIPQATYLISLSLPLPIPG